MAKKIFILQTLKGKYKINEKDSPESEINYDIYSKCSWVSVNYKCEKGSFSANTANEKIVGFTNRQFDGENIDLVISFAQSVRDELYTELMDPNCKIQCDKLVHLKSQLFETTDIYIEPEDVNIEIFFDKKSLTAREKEIFDKEEKKIHTMNAALFDILKVFGRWNDWHDVATIKTYKKFKEEYLSNKAFIRNVIKMYDPEDEEDSICISEFKALL